MAKRLWDKGEELNAQVHAFTVGNDPELDQDLIRWDILASAAHARMLEQINILTSSELSALLTALREALALSDAGKFEIPYELEDGHSALEHFLVERTDDAGRKIHTGRSRNDQVLVAQRLYIKNVLVQTSLLLIDTIETLFQRNAEEGELPMPGYTHMQPAMPSSIGMWLHAFVENFLGLVREGLSLIELADQNPLGAASGFGVPLPLDRDATTDLLGFGKTQRSCIDIQNSRGRYELKTVRWLSDIASAVEKLAWDMILYSSKEFGLISLPKQLTTGSSIMPQKRNPDVLELLRARAAKVRAAELELQLVLAKLPSNYHRDLQYSKEPLIRASKQIAEILPMVTLVIASFSTNEAALRAAMTDELYVTYEAYRLVREGMPFREAYRTTAENFARNQIDYAALVNDFSMIQAQAKKELIVAHDELDELKSELSAHVANAKAVELKVLESTGEARS